MHDVRCFRGEHRGRCKPITLLVGENSTGKSTFLGCYNALHETLVSNKIDLQQPDFNKEPFSMGSFQDIVSSSSRSKTPTNQFKLGLESSRPKFFYRLIATFSEKRAQPVLSSLRFQFEEPSFFEYRRDDDGFTIVEIPGSYEKIDWPFDLLGGLLPPLPEFVSLVIAHTKKNFIEINSYIEELLADYDLLSDDRYGLVKLEWSLPQLTRLKPVAPLRSKPKRTYDPVRETRSPEGEHIPMLMMRLARTDEHSWDSLRRNLAKFGSESGLFSNIEVIQRGEQMSDPFQIQVKVRPGMSAKIIDVGYGVSQSLPILVDVESTEEENQRNGVPYTFLLQQPEVHLHPRAQAELANKFVESWNKDENRFLIETHSDYIIDRIRILIRKGDLKANDVSILYFEPNSNGVKIHSISVDDVGNLINAPESYRRFFIVETDRLLGFSD